MAPDHAGPAPGQPRVSSAARPLVVTAPANNDAAQVREGWIAEHPITGKPVHVVPAEWADAALAAAAERADELEMMARGYKAALLTAQQERDRETELRRKAEKHNRELREYTQSLPYADEWPQLKEDLERAEATNTRLREALRPFAEKWDLHAADYLMEKVDGEEARVLPARVVAEMIEDVNAARAALADTEQETA